MKALHSITESFSLSIVCVSVNDAYSPVGQGLQQQKGMGWRTGGREVSSLSRSYSNCRKLRR